MTREKGEQIEARFGWRNVRALTRSQPINGDHTQTIYDKENSSLRFLVSPYLFSCHNSIVQLKVLAFFPFHLLLYNVLKVENQLLLSFIGFAEIGKEMGSAWFLVFYFLLSTAASSFAEFQGTYYSLSYSLFMFYNYIFHFVIIRDKFILQTLLAVILPCLFEL